MRKLKQAVDDYLLWMISSGYVENTIKRNEKILNHFVYFTQRHKTSWDNVFCSQNIDQFHKSTKCELTAVRGFCRYLVKQKKSLRQLKKKNISWRIPTKHICITMRPPGRSTTGASSRFEEYWPSFKTIWKIKR